ncbi:MAG: hypothetical protein GX130_02210 [Candidatus Hydrogenedens sp.]|jgi:hypothetical protein|nr:hypothetical protein [Candidatus Hydrogenedens sp.]
MTKREKTIKLLLLLIFFLPGGGLVCAFLLYFPMKGLIGSGRFDMHAIPAGEIMPEADDGHHIFEASTELSPVGALILERMSTPPLNRDATSEKMPSPKSILARMAAGKDLEQVNALLCQLYPERGVGSSWWLRRGDYDFKLATWTTLLYLFGHNEERLYPETRRHLLEVLLTESGGSPKTTVPGSVGLVVETENHILLAESSRYLKNQWLHLQGTEEERLNPRHDNKRNGLENWLLSFLDRIIDEGVYEFNSRPYSGYSFHALLNLEGFAEEKALRKKARFILDRENYVYALGSLQLRRFPPFRRQYRRADTQHLSSDPHSAFFYVWTAVTADDERVLPWPGLYGDWSLMASLLPYRLPDDLRHWALQKDAPYYLRFSRGANACPEVYSGGPGWLLSAGGANRGVRSLLVALPITLMLEDGKTTLDECLHLQGKGTWRQWNHTGVYKNFACSNGRAHIPEGWVAEAKASGWSIFRAALNKDLLIALYEEKDISLIVLFPEEAQSPDRLLEKLQQANADARTLEHSFTRPDGTKIHYDLNAPRNRWVITGENNQPLEQNWRHWEQITGTVPHISFHRPEADDEEREHRY